MEGVDGSAGRSQLPIYSRSTAGGSASGSAGTAAMKFAAWSAPGRQRVKK